MIRVILVDETTRVKHVDFHTVPVVQKKDFTCNPDDAMAFRTIVRLSHRIRARRKSGLIGKYLWYRLVGTTPP